MATETLRRTYLEVRQHAGDYTPGRNATRALDQARTLLKWRAAEQAGFVRLGVEDDPDFNPDDYEYPEDFRDSDGENLPAQGTVGRYFTGQDSACNWQHDNWRVADSCWGHVGYKDPGDWRENAYVLDIMAETLDALKASRRRDLSPARPC